MKKSLKRLLTHLVCLSLFAILMAPLSFGVVNTAHAQFLTSVYEDANDSFYSVEQYSATVPQLQRIITVDAKEKPIQEILETIVRKADLGIAYNAELQSLQKPLTLQLKYVTVADALQRVISHTKYEAALSKTREIVLREPLGTLLETSKFIIQQEISGTVTNAETGEPMPGANVYVEGTTVGTSTDAEGNYSLTVADDVDSLTYSFIGYQTQQVPINGRSVINVQLVQKVQAFDELVVTALGITREERAIGYATQEVEGDNLTFANESNVIGSLAGKVAGLRVTGSSGAAVGGASVIQIRGINSIGGGGGALIVVDGTPISNTRFGGAIGTDYGNFAQDINPNSIKSVTVLKGPAATALYGIRGQNGVILYNTKDGSGVDDFIVEVNTGFSVQNVASFMEMQNIYGGGYTQEWQTLPNGQKYVQVHSDESWGPKMDGTPVREFFSFYPQDPRFGQLTPFTASPNNLQNFYETGTTLDQGFTVSGGGDNSNYRLSFNNREVNGVYPNAELGRTNLGISANIDVNEKWSFSTDLSYAANEARRPTQGSQTGRGYFRQWFQRQVSMDELRNYQYPDGEILHWNMSSSGLSTTGELADRGPLYWANPYFSAYESTTHDYRDRIFGNVGATYDALPGLSFSGYIRGDMYIQNIEGMTASGGAGTPGYSFSKYQNLAMNYELIGQYTQDFEQFSLNATVGSNLYHRQYTSLGQSTVGGLLTPGYYNIAATVDRPSVSSYKLEKKILSGYGLVTLGYRDTYFVSLSMRGDKTSTLPEDNNTYWYPSLSGSFVFSEFVDWEPLSFGKLRLSYAQAGDDLDPYETSQIFGIGGLYAGTKTLFIPSNINNPDIEPNISTAYEAGVDLNFYGRLGIQATYYLQKSENQIIALNVSGTTGYGSAIVNAGLIKNQGIELSLTGSPIQTQGFTWNALFNISRNINEVVELHPDIDLYGLGSTTYSGVTTYLNSYEGGPWGVLVGTDFQRDPETGKKLIGPDGMPLFTQSDQRFGSILPDFTGGLQNIFNYKNFSLSTMISFQVGGQFFSRSMLLSRKTGLAPETAAMNDRGHNVRDPVSEGGGVRIDGISAETGEPVTTYVNARAYFNGILGDDIYSWTVVDASYIKLGEVRLGYSFGSGIIENLPVRDIGVAVYARNPLMIWQEAPQGLNPSIMQGWYESSQLPTVRTFGFNLNITF